MMLEYLWLLWLPSAPIMIYFFIRALQNHKAYEKEAFDYQPEKAPKIVFQFCSRDAPPIVYEAIKRVHTACRTLGYEKYQVDLLTDKRPPRGTEKKANVKMVVVPKKYQTDPPVKYKARALQYAVEQRKKHPSKYAQTWIYLLDEESMVTEQTVRALLTYISNKDAKPIAEGGIKYPYNFFQTNLFCSMAETLRTYVCYDCVTQMSSGGMPSHMHGSNLLVRSTVEAQIGWAHKKVDASEDQRFGWEATLELGKGIFGCHGGTIEEQPATTVRDFVKQRQRWFVGNIHNLQNTKISTKKKISISLRWIAWWAGFPSGLASFAILLIPQNIPNWLQIFLLFNTFTWLIGYQVGLRLTIKNLGMPKHKTIMWHLITLVMTPFVGILETYSVFVAPLQLRNFERNPTPKRNPPQEETIQFYVPPLEPLLEKPEKRQAPTKRR